MSQKSESNPPLESVKAYFKGRPIVFCELPYGLALELGNAPYRFERFTHTWDRLDLQKTKLPTLAVVEISPDPTRPFAKDEPPVSGCFLARLERSGKVASFQVRLKFSGAFALGFESLEDLVGALLRSPEAEDIGEGLRASGGFSPLSVLQEELIEFLWGNHREAFVELMRALPGALEVSEVLRQQEDAMALAKAFFGLRSGRQPEDEIHVQEQGAIARDAAVVPGFELISANVQNSFRFRQGDEELVIYNAHQGPIEELLGVDLVYVNETMGSVVMVQYKVLTAARNQETGRRDWIFRPDDQFHDEIERMRLPPLTGTPDDYRLHRDPFFFKFVRRKQRAFQQDTALVLSLAHVRYLLEDENAAGPNGGVRFSYDALKGQYLRASDFVGLVRSGYIGTHRIESSWLTKLLEEISAGKRGLVLGHQRRIH